MTASPNIEGQTIVMKRTVSWDDIPTLDGVGVDWAYKPQTTLDKRAFIRLDMRAISQLMAAHSIVVRLVTVKNTYESTLVDISQGGLAVHLFAELTINQPVKVGLFLGKEKIISRGMVRHVKPERNHSIVCIQFIDLAQESVEYIAGLYAAKVLYHAA
jgi:hypothetical protein